MPQPNIITIKKTTARTITMHATATVNGQVIAETDTYEVVEGNIYVCIMSSNVPLSICKMADIRVH